MKMLACIFLLLTLGVATAWTASGALVVKRDGRTLELSGALPPDVSEVELHIFSDRNDAISKFSDVSPLDPKKSGARRKRNSESWYPVVDVELSADMEGIAALGPLAPGGSYSVNGAVRREKSPVATLITIPAARLEHWENTIWLEPDSTRLNSFHLRRTIRVTDRSWHATLRLLSDDWSGTLTLHAGGREIGRVALPRTRLQSRPIPGEGMDRRRLIESLAATVAYTLRNHYRKPGSPFDGGLHIFYDLDARVYRSVNWIWGYGPSVRLLLDAARLSEVASRFQPGELLKVADEIGRMTLRWSENSPIDMMTTSRWSRTPDLEFGHGQIITPADSLFLMGWAWIPLYEATGDVRYLEASRRMAASVARLTKEWDLIPQNFWPDTRTWDDTTIDESGFGTEGFAELFRVTRDARYRDLGNLYMEQILAKLERPDGLWEGGYDRSRGVARPTSRMTRGLGWAMEGLLANSRMDPQGKWLHKAQQMAGHLLRAQLEDGSWTFEFDKPASEVGISEKGTALWSLLFYRTYAGSNDARHRDAARKALRWCLNNQYTGPDPEAHGGLVGATRHSAVGYRPWFRVSCTYSSAFFGLAALEELRLAGQLVQSK